MKKTEQVSKRLQAVISLVEPGNRFADIGCDHGLVPVCLVGDGICPSGIAADVKDGPLARAKKQIDRAGLADAIEVRKSDGVKEIKKGEVQTIIIAGMGGPLLLKILQESPETVKSAKELVLSPQSKIADVRAFLRGVHFPIAEEKMVFEDGKYYTVMKVLPDGTFFPADAEWISAEDCYGGTLLRKKDPVLLSYLTYEEEKDRRILQNLSGQEEVSGRSRERKSQLEEQLELIGKVRKHYYDL